MMRLFQMSNVRQLSLTLSVTMDGLMAIMIKIISIILKIKRENICNVIMEEFGKKRRHKEITTEGKEIALTQILTPFIITLIIVIIFMVIIFIIVINWRKIKNSFNTELYDDTGIELN